MSDQYDYIKDDDYQPTPWVGLLAAGFGVAAGVAALLFFFVS